MGGHQEPKTRRPLAPPSKSQCSNAGEGGKGPGKERGDQAAASRACLQRMAFPPTTPRETGRTVTWANGDGKGWGRGIGTEGFSRCRYSMGKIWELKNSNLLQFQLYPCRHHIRVIQLCHLQSLARSRYSINLGARKDTEFIAPQGFSKSVLEP